MQEVVSLIGSHCVAVREALSALLGHSGNFNFEADYLTANNGMTLREVVTRGEAILAAVEPISAMTQENLVLAPLGQLKSLAENLSAFASAVDSLRTQLEQLQSWGGIARTDPNGTVFAPNNQQMALRPPLDRLTGQVDGILTGYIHIAVATKPRAVGSFSAAAKKLQETAADFDGKLMAVGGALQSLEGKLQTVAASEESAAQSATKVGELLTGAQLESTSISEQLSVVTAARAEVEKVQKEAAALRAAVLDYQEQFEGFQKSLEQRSLALKEGNASLTKLTASLTEKEGEAQKLIMKAEEMLGGATIAGLSAAYSAQADSIDGQLSAARNWYYGSIFLLIISVLVALKLFTFWGGLQELPALPVFSADQSVGAIAVQILAGLGSRLLLVLPALLLLGFTSHRHSMLFRLREEYNHKYAIAASVHGFKQQAPEFEEPIAAAVFQELLQNPADSMDERKARRENGFLARIIQPQVEAALERMKVLDKALGGKAD